METRFKLFLLCVLVFNFVQSSPDAGMATIVNDAIANHPIIQHLLLRVEFLEEKDKINSEIISDLKIRLERCEGQHERTEESMDKTINNSSDVVDQTARTQRPVKPRGRIEATKITQQTAKRSKRSYDGNYRIRQVNHGDTVAFFARSITPDLHLGPNQNIIFENVPTNLGNGYNNHHGIFIAPISGTYVFFTTILADNNAEVWVHFSVNGVYTAGTYARGTDGRHDSGSQTIIVTLTQGDDVAVQSNRNNESVYGGMYTTFSGFLLCASLG